MANLFWVSGGRGFTPDPSCGCRKGVVRRWVLEKSGLDITEVSAAVEELNAADEIFLTNSRIGILPVTRWRDQSLKPGSITTRLWKQYQQAFLSL
jgi:branched-subunit amino acid aminotransferase/4-amino-4-deoxychorismate lyase